MDTVADHLDTGNVADDPLHSSGTRFTGQHPVELRPPDLQPRAIAGNIEIFDTPVTASPPDDVANVAAHRSLLDGFEDANSRQHLADARGKRFRNAAPVIHGA